MDKNDSLSTTAIGHIADIVSTFTVSTPHAAIIVLNFFADWRK